MKKVLFIIAILTLAIPIYSKAYQCSNSDMDYYQKLSDNVSPTIEEQENGTFSVIFSGVSKSIRIYNTKNGAYYWNLTPNFIGETRVDNLNLGETYSFEIYTFSEICLLKKFRIITVNIPNKNPFYDDEVCLNARDYSLCQKWATVNITHDEFVQKVNDYIKKNNNTKKDTNSVDTKKFDFFTFYQKYYWPTFIGMICILSLLIFLWAKENKKNKL